MSSNRDTQYWALYVDESGRFNVSDEHVLVAGVLTPSDRDPFFDSRLRAELEEAAPVIPWPPHAWLVKKPAMYAVWQTIDNGRDGHESLQQTVERLQHLLVEHGQQGNFENVCRTVESGGEPSREEIHALRRELQKVSNSTEKQPYRALRAYRTRAVARLQNVISLSWRETNKGREPVGFIGTETDIGDAYEPTRDSDRYLSILTALFERIRDVLGRYSGQHVVDVYLADRHVNDPNLPRRQHLNRSHLEEVDQQSSEQFSCDGEIRDVRFTVGGIQSYDPEVSGGLVLADLMANTTWRWTRVSSSDEELTLEELQRWSLSTLHLPIETTSADAEEMSHVAATGSARELVNEARRSHYSGEPFERRLPLDTPARNWIRRQANRWAEVIT